MELVIHDLKNDKSNVSGGLAGVYKIVPVAFYLGGVLSILLSLYFYFSFKAYKSAELSMNSKRAAAQSELTRITAQEARIVATAERATGLAEWLEGARPLQPVTVAVARSMEKESTVAELSLIRNPEIPANTFMELKINGGGSQQIETTLNSIYGLNYQAYSAQQVKGKNALDFQATLIYNDKNKGK